MTDEAQIKKINEFIKKAENLKKEEKIELSADQDLSIAIMNLISIEEHFMFTGARTEKTKYYDLIDEVRTMRRGLLQRIIKNPEGEVWCISKHLLSAAMRLMEVGTKHLAYDKKTAYEFFTKSYELYSLFWGLALKLIDTGNIAAIDDNAVNKRDKEKNSLMGKLGGMVKKVIDCCIE